MNEARVALVTGSRTGIGRAVAEHLLASGYAVEGCSRSPCDWTAEGYHHHTVDVADEKAVRRMVASIRERHRRLDVLINNAGLASMNAALLTPGEVLDKILATNIRGVFLVAREAAKLMQRRRYGRIVNLTTVAVPLALEGESAYVASKSAVVGLTRVLARELAPMGITCNAVGPGPVETAMTRALPRETLEALVARLPLKRMCTIADVTNVIDFLIRPESDGVTGQVIYLCGAG